MSRTERSRPTRVAVLIMCVVGTLALAACGAGQLAQTSQQVSAVDGAEAGSGTMVVRDAKIEFEEAEGANVYRRGGNAPLQMSIINNGPNVDRLVSVTSVVADRVAISGDLDIPGDTAVVVEGEPAGSVPAPDATTTGAPGAPGATGAPAPGATTPATPTALTPPAPAAPTSAAPTTTASAPPAPGAGAERRAQIVLTGLRDDIRSGLTYEIVMTFERAGEIRFAIPVATSAAPRRDESAA